MVSVIAGHVGPSLDRSGEVWVGQFPGLGSIAVGPDGSVEVIPEADDQEDLYLRAQALRHGWAEGLSFVRRGYLLAGAAAVCPTPSARGCVLLAGHPHDVAIVIERLVRHGWTVMGDRFTPVRWEGRDLVAAPREAPVLMARKRADTAFLVSREVRADSDSRAVDLPRHTSPATVRAVVQVGLRRPQEENLVPLLGTQRFEAAAGMLLAGVLDPTAAEEAKADDLMERHLRLSGLPQASLRIDPRSPEQEVESLLKWLARTGITESGPA